MTVLADIRGLNVSRCLSRRVRTVVAADAIVKDIRMIERGRKPAGCRVAILALIGGGYVARRFPGCLDAVVTTHATACQRRVVDERNNVPARSNMAVRAFTRCLNMVRRFR